MESPRAPSSGEDGVRTAKPLTAVKTAHGTAGSARCGFVMTEIIRETASCSGTRAGSSENPDTQFMLLTMLYSMPRSNILKTYY